MGHCDLGRRRARSTIGHEIDRHAVRIRRIRVRERGLVNPRPHTGRVVHRDRRGDVAGLD